MYVVLLLFTCLSSWDFSRSCSKMGRWLSAMLSSRWATNVLRRLHCVARLKIKRCVFASSARSLLIHTDTAVGGRLSASSPSRHQVSAMCLVDVVVYGFVCARFVFPSVRLVKRIFLRRRHDTRKNRSIFVRLVTSDYGTYRRSLLSCCICLLLRLSLRGTIPTAIHHHGRDKHRTSSFHVRFARR